MVGIYYPVGERFGANYGYPYVIKVSEEKKLLQSYVYNPLSISEFHIQHKP
jgi:hypothetical protein